jgi:hypothetical protein
VSGAVAALLAVGPGGAAVAVRSCRGACGVG